jgi:hypothetical protein
MSEHPVEVNGFVAIVITTKNVCPDIKLRKNNGYTCFHLFHKLPLELQRLIWKCGFSSPRKIHCSCTFSKRQNVAYQETSFVNDYTLRSILQANHESRAFAQETYTLAFGVDYFSKGFTKTYMPPHSSYGTYVDFSRDTFVFNMFSSPFQRLLFQDSPLSAPPKKAGLAHLAKCGTRNSRTKFEELAQISSFPGNYMRIISSTTLPTSSN